jgi:signal transduction histidine kinase
MSVGADAQRTAPPEATTRIPQGPEGAASLGSFTRRRVERVLTIAIAIGCLILGAQAFFTALGPSDEAPGWHVPLMVLTFGPLAAMVIACAVGRAERVFAAIFCVCYVVALALWPAATAGQPSDPTTQPWIWYLVNVATVASVIVVPFRWQVAWTLMVPMFFGSVRILQTDAAAALWIPLVLDVSFALILGMMLITLGRVFRRIAADVDDARTKAVASYARAAAANAAEEERIAVAALMHDSVLAALIASERADTERERTLAVAMAREALTRFANTEQGAEEGSDEPTDARALADAVERAAENLGAAPERSRDIDPGTPALPGRVARALTLAATQAVANAVEHARGQGLAVRVSGRPDRIAVIVSDTGDGFDLHAIPDDRLGIRASIVARVAAVGGIATVEPTPEGTTVTLEWRPVSA